MNHQKDFSGNEGGSDNTVRPPDDLGAVGERDFAAELRRGLEKNRLPADLKKQILAALPSPEEQERLIRELREHGGLSSDEFLASLGLEGERLT